MVARKLYPFIDEKEDVDDIYEYEVLIDQSYVVATQ